MTVCVFLHIDTGDILIGDVNMTNHYLSLVSKWFDGTEVLEFHELSRACLAVKAKYAVIVLITIFF